MTYKLVYFTVFGERFRKILLEKVKISQTFFFFISRNIENYLMHILGMYHKFLLYVNNWQKKDNLYQTSVFLCAFGLSIHRIKV